MNKKFTLTILIAVIVFVFISFKHNSSPEQYMQGYSLDLDTFVQSQKELFTLIQKSNIHSTADLEKIRMHISHTRSHFKGMDFWFRYLEPLAQKKINGPLPVEWETEVFEKFEKPYKREGAGLALATLYLDEEEIVKDTLLKLIQSSLDASQTFRADSITNELKTYHHFFLCNRLFLLNLATIYTSGFECPDTSRIIPELRIMLKDISETYRRFNASFPDTPLPDAYLALYAEAQSFVSKQPSDYTRFDHFNFLRKYVNPLFVQNQTLILQYRVVSRSLVDYSLNKKSTSIFDKTLYTGQNPKGIFLRVNDAESLAEIEKMGKLLFYDPILSGNNMRSCASCHIPTEYFTDTIRKTALQFNRTESLPRNTPSLLNVQYNHLIMMDGAHISLQNQTKDVISNAIEMGSNEREALAKVLSCDDYAMAFKKLAKLTPQEPEVTYDHIISAITLYYSKFSRYSAPFDDAMNNQRDLDKSVQEGFNLFMGKAQCATCHFAPQFNGVKPPYIGSEFEVLGIPSDPSYASLSADPGRFGINPAQETANAFRTGTLRNAAYTMPYMHNGVFKTMREVIEFYNGGGGAGRGLPINNQTLSSDSLHLSPEEIDKLLLFIHSLNENIPFEKPPTALPVSRNRTLNQRKTGGEY